MTINVAEIIFVLSQLEKKGLIESIVDGFRPKLSPLALATWADDYIFIQKEIESRLAPVLEQSTLIYTLTILSKVSNAQPLYPTESRYPVLRAVATMSQESQEKLLEFIDSIRESHANLYHEPLIDSIRLMLRDVSPDWLADNAPNLVGKTVYEVSPEVSDVRGGLGRVEQYHATAMKQLGAKVAFVEPYYRTRPDEAGHLSEADYSRVGVPLNNIRPVLDLLTGQPMTLQISMSDQESPVMVEVFVGVNEFGIESYLVRDMSGKYVKTLYQYDTSKGYVSNAVFTEFFTKAIWNFIFLRELAEKKSKETKGESYQPAVINVNDGQSLMTTVWATVSYYEAFSSGNEELADFISKFFLSGTTHTYRNRGFFGGENDYDSNWRDKFLQMGVPENLHWLFFSKWKGTEDEVPRVVIDFTSAGLNAAHYRKAVSSIHAKEMARNNPNIQLVGVTNGDNRSFSSAVFRKILKEVTDQRGEIYNPEFPTPEQIQAVKKISKERLIETLNTKRRAFGTFDVLGPVTLNSDQVLFSYSGRWVAEKAGMNRAFTTDNILKVVQAGGQIVIFGNVQPYDESIVLGKQMKDLEITIATFKREHPDLYPGNFIFMPKFELQEQIELFAATDMQIQDSDRHTGAAEYTEADISANGGLQMSPPFHEGIIANQGRPLDYKNPGIGNTIIPYDSTPKSYQDAMLRILNMDQSALAKYQAASVRLSRILEARLTGAEYLRQWNANVLQEHQMASEKSMQEVEVWKVAVMITDQNGTSFEVMDKDMLVPQGGKVKIMMFVDLKGLNPKLVQNKIISDQGAILLQFKGMYKGKAVYEADIPTEEVGALKLQASSGMWNTLENFYQLEIVKPYQYFPPSQLRYDVGDDGDHLRVLLRIPDSIGEKVAIHWGVPGEKGWNFKDKSHIEVRRANGVYDGNKPFMSKVDGFYEIEFRVPKNLNLSKLIFSFVTWGNHSNEIWNNNNGLDWFIDLSVLNASPIFSDDRPAALVSEIAA